jgi:GNAT superfamily N-acetyltransferase
MDILEINNKADWKLFHKVPHLIYKNDPLWITPLEKDIQGVFSPSKNKAFKDGEAKCWVLLDAQKTPIGRISAFIDHGRNKRSEHKKGGFGFFECINDEPAARMLFKTAESHLIKKRIQIIDGPINFGERDKFWGLLVKGWYAPIYTENYNPEYYIPFFENQGYQPYERVFTLKGTIAEVPIESHREKARKYIENYGFEVRTIDPKKLQQHAEEMCEVYNAAFANFPYFKPLTSRMVYNLFKQVKPVIDPKIACFVYVNDRPVGFCMLMPEVNQFFKRARGKMNLLTLPGILFRKFRPGKKLIKGIGFGIHPDYQGKGVMAVMVAHIYDHSNKYYSHVFLTTIRQLNKKMLNSVNHLNVKVDREHIAYRKILDDKIPFKPLSFENVLAK